METLILAGQILLFGCVAIFLTCLFIWGVGKALHLIDRM